MAAVAYKPLTVSGSLITDALRARGIEGDGRLSDSSFGIWEGTENLCTNGGFETNLAGWVAGAGGGTLAQDSVSPKFGTKALKVTPASAGGIAQAETTVVLSAGVPYTLSAFVKPEDGEIDLWAVEVSSGLMKRSASFTGLSVSSMTGVAMTFTPAAAGSYRFGVGTLRVAGPGWLMFFGRP